MAFSPPFPLQGKTTDGLYYSTPTDQNTEPQDPGKPLLSSRSSEEESIPDSSQYSWNHLWKRLETCGWKCIKARNRLDNWWYVRPNRIPPLTQGEDYFVSPEQVIQYCKEWDEEERNANHKHKSNKRSKNHHHHRDHISLASSSSSTFKEEEEPPKRSNNKPNKDKGGKPEPRTRANSKEPLLRVVPKRKPTTHLEASTHTKDQVVDKEPFAVDPQHNTAPWATDCPIPRDLFALCRDVGGISYRGSSFYLPGESAKQYSIRFSSLAELQQHYCQANNATNIVLLKEPPSTPERQQQYLRWIHYAFVPARHYDWFQTRWITRDEMCQLLTKVGYSCYSSKDGVWTRPHTNESYDSLQALCEALRTREHWQGGSSSSSRRRGSSSSSPLTDHELLALKLRIAEGVGEEDHRFGTGIRNARHTRKKVKSSHLITTPALTHKSRNTKRRKTGQFQTEMASGSNETKDQTKPAETREIDDDPNEIENCQKQSAVQQLEQPQSSPIKLLNDNPLSSEEEEQPSTTTIRQRQPPRADEVQVTPNVMSEESVAISEATTTTGGEETRVKAIAAWLAEVIGFDPPMEEMRAYATIFYENGLHSVLCIKHRLTKNDIDDGHEFSSIKRFHKIPIREELLKDR